jgi:Alpha/beta hydrolase domain
MTTRTTATFAPAPKGRGIPFGATSLDLASKGYVEEEYSASGTANRYRMNFTSTYGAGGTAGQPDDPLATAEVVDAGHPYTTRILVRRHKPQNGSRLTTTRSSCCARKSTKASLATTGSTGFDPTRTQR